MVWEHDANVRGRLFNNMGMAALNRESDPNTDDFVVATGATGPDVAVGGPDPGIWMAVYESAGDIGGRRFPLP